MEITKQEIEFNPEDGSIISVTGASAEENKNLKETIELAADCWRISPQDYCNSKEFKKHHDTPQIWNKRIKGHPKEREFKVKL